MGNTLSSYSRVFDKRNPNWYNDNSLNRLFIQAQENYANNLLIVRGYLFLNEVYDMLGLKRSKDGVVIGWIKSPNSTSFVEFSMHYSNEALILDFNVDGDIYDRIVW